MANATGGASWLWISGLDTTYNRPVRAHVLKSYLSERSRRAEEKARLRNKEVELAWRPPTGNMEEGGPSSAIRTAINGKGAPEGLPTEIIRTFNTPNIQRPSHSLISYDFFVQNFCRYGRIPTQSGASFMTELLYVETRNPDLLILRKAVRGSASVFFGILTGNTVAVQEGHRWGITALRAVNQQLQLIQVQRDASPKGAGHARILPSRDLISASLMLAFYECACGSSPTAWIHHLLGAEALILMLDPEKCQTGYELNLFRSLRYAAVSASIVPSF